LTGDLSDAAFSFSTTTGVITFDASDVSVYNGKSFSLTVTANEAFSTSSASYSFTLNMNDPCEGATITDDITWQNMVTTVGFEGTLVSPTQTQTFAEYKDSVSTVNGDNSGTTFCGNRKYTFTISPTPNPVTPSPIALNTGTRTFSLDTDEATHATVVYTITLTITLADYEASITALTKTFTATVNPCIITGQASGNELAGTTQTYNLGAAPKDILYAVFTFSPTVCTNYVWTYTAQWDDAGTLKPLPTGITHTAGTKFVVSTSNTADEGTFTIILTGTLSDAAATVVTQTFIIDIRGCEDDTVSLTTAFTTPVNYIIGSGSQSWTAAFDHEFSSCPVTYAVTGDTAHPTYSSSDATISINSANDAASTYNGASLTFTVTYTSTGSTNSITSTIVINFVNPCTSTTIVDSYAW